MLTVISLCSRSSVLAVAGEQLASRIGNGNNECLDSVHVAQPE